MMKTVKKALALVLVVATLGSMLAFTAAAAAPDLAYGAATVSATKLNIRKEASTSAEILSTIGDQAIVVILKKTSSDWYYINYHGTEGYVNTEYLTNVLTAENFSATGTVLGTSVYVRKGPSTETENLATVTTNDELAVIGINNGWYKVKTGSYTGYIRSDLMRISGGYKVATQSASTASGAYVRDPDATTAQQLVDFALQYVGYNYKYGGTSPSTGFDCSGFTTYCYKEFGISLTRSSSGQYKNDGVSVPKDQLQPGDLLFFSPSGDTVSHVAIYIGDNEFVHASTPKNGVLVSRLDSTYYINAWHGAKRVL